MDALVSYGSSDDDSDADGKAQAAKVQVTTDAGAAPRLVHTSLGVTRRGPQRGDWLCHVFIPLDGKDDDDDGYTRLFRRARKGLKSTLQKGEDADSEACSSVHAPHISLTRPIVLRRHECDDLVPLVRKAVQAYHRASPHANRLAIAFSTFSTLPSEDRSRLYFAADVSQGWRELRRLTTCLDTQLAKLHARPYYEQARFHASFAHTGIAATADADEAIRALEEQLGTPLRACGALIVDRIAVAIGPTMHYVPL